MRVAVAPLHPALYRDLVRRALEEDISTGDITTAGTVSPEQRARAIVLAKSPCVIAGLDVAGEAFRQMDGDVPITVHHPDGSICPPGTTVAELRGRAAGLLTAERTALNFIQRLSGTATLAHRF